jgi:hypothetical protein
MHGQPIARRPRTGHGEKDQQRDQTRSDEHGKGSSGGGATVAWRGGSRIWSIEAGMRRFTRLTNAFSKKFENHFHMIALYTLFYNFARIHKTVKMSPAMAAGITDTLRSMEDIAALCETKAPAKRPYKKAVA